MRQGMIIAGFAVLGAVAVAGWARKPAAPGYAAVSPQPGYPTAAVGEASQPCVQPAFAPTSAQPGQPYAQPAYYVPVEPYATRPAVRVVRQAVPEQRIVEQRVVREAPARHTVSRRSTKKSVAIVAGGAGAGAAIGALAGGGKGAAIGALTGGVGGFVYDRLTHEQRR